MKEKRVLFALGDWGKEPIFQAEKATNFSLSHFQSEKKKRIIASLSLVVCHPRTKHKKTTTEDPPEECVDPNDELPTLLNQLLEGQNELEMDIEDTHHTLIDQRSPSLIDQSYSEEHCGWRHPCNCPFTIEYQTVTYTDDAYLQTGNGDGELVLNVAECGPGDYSASV